MGFLSSNPPSEIKLLAASVKQLFIAQRDSSYGFGLWKYVATKTYREFVRSEETVYKYVRKEQKYLQYMKVVVNLVFLNGMGFFFLLLIKICFFFFLV